MSKLVVLNLGKGSLREGFKHAIAQIYERRQDVNVFLLQFTGSLPPAPEITDLYRRWQILYNLLYDSLIPDLNWRQEQELDTEIEISSEDVTNISSIEFHNLCEDLKDNINTWLNSQSFASIEQKLRTKLNTEEEIQLVIQTDVDEIRRLPWNLWEFFEDYPHAVLCLSTSEFEKLTNANRPLSDRIRILAILGNSQNIDIQEDKRILKNLPNAEITFLVESNRQDLDSQLWDKRGWDILFFAGHSYSEADGDAGKIYINRQDSLTIEQLKNGLKSAISRGLRLAIFNSCDGLGLATQLSSLHIPQMIIMREPVPDLVAQKFLKFFLSAFSERKSFYFAVREAGERLQGLEAQFPCASWLPVIYQNPTEAPLIWSKPTKQLKRNNNHNLSIHKIIPVILSVSLAIVITIMGVRNLGLVQQLELTFFDQMMLLRPDEGKDNRIVIVEITGSDVEVQNALERGGTSISDRNLAKLIEKLEQYKPRVIGLDIYRENPVKEEYPDLASWMKTSSNFIGVCKVSEGIYNPGIRGPWEVPPQNLGFSDVVEDYDNNLRRHLLAMAPAPPCNTDKSFSFQLASRYLEKENIQLELSSDIKSRYFKILDNSKSSNNINNIKNSRTLNTVTKLTNNFLPKYVTPKYITSPYLENNSGGYSNIDYRGYQLMLNWRSTPEIATRIKLQDVLNSEFPAGLFEDKIITIGTTAESFQDNFITPFNSSSLESSRTRTPGIIIHAHMISQLLSAALDNRPLLRTWSKWSEAVWIYCWSTLGCIIAWRIKSLAQLILSLVIFNALLYYFCFVLLQQGIWVPFIPSVLALVLGSYGFIAYNRSVEREKDRA